MAENRQSSIVSARLHRVPLLNLAQSRLLRDCIAYLYYVLFKLVKYCRARCITLGASISVANIVGIAIKAKKVSIRLIISSKEVVAPIKILAI